MKLTITRHGETEENIAGILQGHLPGKLSIDGIEQAKKLALKLKNEKFDFIYSSDLERASKTAKEIAKYHPNTKIEFIKSLRERDIGELQGKKESELDWDTKDKKATFIVPKGAETMKDVYKRAEKFLHEIILKHHTDSLLFVCHGAIGKALVAVIIGKKDTEIQSVEDLLNTSISTFEIDKDKNSKTISYNCVEHLD